MRGVVFTELIEFVENALGFDTADKMIEKANLENDGAFSQGGNYPFSHMQKLLHSLSEITGKSKDELLFVFGKHLFSVLAKLYQKNMTDDLTALTFLDSVENFVHVEVKKLYPDADLPKFTTEEIDETHIVLIYQSEKRLESFAKGLMVSCGEYFNEPLEIKHEVINENPYQVKFFIEKK